MITVQTKYDPGQGVYLMYKNKPCYVIIVSAVISIEKKQSPKITYLVRLNVFGDNFSVNEDSIASSLDELKEKIFG